MKMYRNYGNHLRARTKEVTKPINTDNDTWENYTPDKKVLYGDAAGEEVENILELNPNYDDGDDIKSWPKMTRKHQEEVIVEYKKLFSDRFNNNNN
eukprot:Pgem_evm1s8620